MTQQGDRMRVQFWTNIPNHYQSSFYAELRALSVDVRVSYYARTPPARRALGWDEPARRPPGEQYVEAALNALKSDTNWRERIHVVPGYGCRFARALVREFVRSGVSWVHWSEPSHPGVRWWLSYPVKRWYGRLVRRYALGAFGIGVRALEDFSRWGIPAEKTALLPYSAPEGSPDAEPDRTCQAFRSGRFAFLYLGSLCQRKGIDVLLRAFARVATVERDSRLILVGDGPTGGLYRQQAHCLGVAERVLFRGAVPPSALPGVLRCANTLVLPSRFDGWGVCLNEAASMGLALIASDQVGAAYHLIEPGRNGIRVKSACADALTAALLTYARNSGLAEQHGRQSRVIARSYAPGANARHFLAAVQVWQAMASARTLYAGADRASSPLPCPQESEVERTTASVNQTGAE